MKKISETKSISELLNTFTFGDTSKGKSLSNVVKQSTVFSFWEDIAGKKLAKFTKPEKIKYSKLYISAKSPVIVQELNLIKSDIIKKINVYTNALGIKINDIVANYKNYSEKTSEEQYIQEEIEFYNNSNLSNIKIDENYKKDISDRISKIKMLSEKQKTELTDKIINLKKAEIKRTLN